MNLLITKLGNYKNFLRKKSENYEDMQDEKKKKTGTLIIFLALLVTQQSAVRSLSHTRLQ